MRDVEIRDNEYWDTGRVRLFKAQWLTEKMESEARVEAPGRSPRRRSERPQPSA